MPRSYPVTPRNRDGQVPSAENFNDAVRETLEVSQSLTSENFAEATIPVEKVKIGTFQSFFEWNDTDNDPILTISEQNRTQGSIFVTKETVSEVERGVVKGNLQVLYQAHPTKINADGLMYGDITVYGATGTNQPYCDFPCAIRFFILANGHKCGETEWISEGVTGTTAIPCLWYHDGGDITFELYVEKMGGDTSDGYPNTRAKVRQVYGTFCVRSR